MGLRARLGRLLRRATHDPVLQAEVARLRFAMGDVQARAARQAATPRDAEFSCYSQFGEDGIIQWLIARVPVDVDTFVEIGVQDYQESNTRFLLEHDNWKGRIVDAGHSHDRFLRATGLAWRHSIEAISAFVTRDNVNDYLAELPRDIGLLSIDIDGNDYWILDAMDAVSPRILITEYNSLWGRDRAVAVPYDPAFDREKAHSSWLYWGASLGALEHWARRHDYRLVASNRAGHNAFFVRSDVAGELPGLTAREAWVASRYRESRDPDGNLSYVDDHQDRRRLMADMPLLDVVSGQSLHVADLA